MISVNTLIAQIESEENTWIARVIEINGNDLKVKISSDTGARWFETWNLAHTETGLNNKTYYIVGKCHD